MGRVWPRHGHRGRPLNSVVRCLPGSITAMNKTERDKMVREIEEATRELEAAARKLGERTGRLAESEASPKTRPPDKAPYCSFCQAGANNVKRLVAGPGVYICDECIRVSSEIVESSDSNGKEDI